MSERLTAAFDNTLSEGERRLRRTILGLLATGAMGGIDVGLGVFGFLLVLHDTGSELAGALAFGFGFVALTLGSSELFTENFLVPIAAVAEGRARLRLIPRLWVGTLLANLAGGWVITGLMLASFPDLGGEAVKVGGHFVAEGIGWRSFAGAALGGTIITLMTWMERSTDSMPAKLVAAVGAGFLLAAGRLNHAIVMSLDVFAALHAGAPFGYLAWLRVAAWAALGNMVGGIALVTVLRVVQGRANRRAEELHEAELWSAETRGARASGSSDGSDRWIT